MNFRRLKPISGVYLTLKPSFVSAPVFVCVKLFRSGLLSQMYEINARSFDHFTLKICTSTRF